ncbi:MAG: DNA-processing protein DprA [bacterium]
MALNLIPGMNISVVRRLCQVFGSVDMVLKASAEQLSKVEGVTPELAKNMSSFHAEKALKKEKGLMAQHKVDFLTIEDPGYPESLSQIFDPPLVLYIKGRIIPDDKMSVAIVGSRRPTIYGKTVAEDFAERLACRGITIVSGLARGIDTKAHRGALKGGGRTIAVLGSGMDRVYPRENKPLVGAVVENGAVVSEFPMGTAPLKQNFPMRNRIISGLALGTMVVEAGDVSGALITARLALEQGRDVFAVPGPVNSPLSKGTNGLIKQGARLADDVEDIFEELGPHLGPLMTREAPPVRRRSVHSDGDDPVLSVLTGTPQHIDALVEKTGLTARQLGSRLVHLEMKGMVTKLPGNMYVRG